MVSIQIFRQFAIHGYDRPQGFSILKFYDLSLENTSDRLIITSTE